MNYERKHINIRKRRALFAFFGPLLILLLGAVVMWLWNAILPQVLVVNRINYWQALGLFLLCRILFGGFGFKGRSGRFEGGENWRNKWQNMTEEERKNFKDRWRQRCEERKKWKEQ